MVNETFITEVNLIEVFKPPAVSGVKIQRPIVGDKDLIFPEVKPRRYIQEDLSQGYRIFGNPSWGYVGKKPIRNRQHFRERNILCPPMYTLPSTVSSISSRSSTRSLQQTGDSITKESKPERKEHENECPPVVAVAVTTAAPEPDQRSVCSSSACSSASSRATAFACASREGTKKAEVLRPPASVASSVVSHASAYEGLVSVSQAPSSSSRASSSSKVRPTMVSGVESTTGGCAQGSEMSAAARSQLKKLEVMLEEERRLREMTQQQLAAVEQRQKELLQRLKSFDEESKKEKPGTAATAAAGTGAVAVISQSKINQK